VNKVLRSLEGMGIVSLDFGRVPIVDDEALNAYLAATAAHCTTAPGQGLFNICSAQVIERSGATPSGLRQR